MFGFIKSFDEKRRIGIVETITHGNLYFILRDGEEPPPVNSNVSFDRLDVAMNLTVIPESQTRTYRG
jgi:hypothetical protein